MKDYGTEKNICSKCGKSFCGAPALSRMDNTTNICPDCGLREALDSIGYSAEEQEIIINVINQCKED